MSYTVPTTMRLFERFYKITAKSRSPEILFQNFLEESVHTMCGLIAIFNFNNSCR